MLSEHFFLLQKKKFWTKYFTCIPFYSADDFLISFCCCCCCCSNSTEIHVSFAWYQITTKQTFLASFSINHSSMSIFNWIFLNACWFNCSLKTFSIVACWIQSITHVITKQVLIRIDSSCFKSFIKLETRFEHSFCGLWHIGLNNNRAIKLTQKFAQNYVLSSERAWFNSTFVQILYLCVFFLKIHVPVPKVKRTEIQKKNKNMHFKIAVFVSWS